MWKLVLVLMVLTNGEQRLIVQQPLDRGFASKAECDAFAANWPGQARQPELLRLAESRAPAHRGQIKQVSLLDAGCADPAWSGAYPVLKPEEGFPPAPGSKPAH